ncbi:HDOD domain-containing protein [Thioalkalivibrio sulfidiphilus]|uniref:HDOD domain-containing protein n=1 Tax=Thioalkalivibrio sulfidiphilus TaxID=1033854 RepID=UPI0003726427|nr:HDOD domain-containing protein [Thioalkalivibrio sulfidiphilus]
MTQSLEQIASEFVPLKELSEQGRAALLQQAVQDTLAAGAKINATDHREHLVYLLEGSLGLVSQGKANRVTADAPRARLPLFPERISNEFAVAESTCRLLVIDKAAFGDRLNDERTAGFEVNDVEINADEGRIFQEIYEATLNNRLELPPMPEVAIRIQRMADDPDVGIPELTKVVQMDAAVAGALLHATNSPLYRGAQPITNIRDAVVRLGLKTTRMLATNIAMRQTFKADSSLVKERMRQLWEHSVNVSAIAYVLARKSRKFDPERALLAGLMHDIGVIPILKYMENQGTKLSPEALESTLFKLHGMTGVLVMNYWGMDPELVTVAEEADNWMRDTGEKPDYCDLVIVSQLLSYLNTPRMASLPDPNQVPAFKKMDIGSVDADMNLAILDEVRDELEAIKHVLNA